MTVQSILQVLRRRIIAILTTIVVAAVCGVIAVLLLESAIALKSAHRKLELDANRILKTADDILDESHAVMSAMNASQNPPCSTAEFIFLRKLIFSSEYFRDAGHIRNGRIECSVSLGTENLPRTQFEPVASFIDGLSIYKDFSPYHPHDEDVFGLQMGDMYLVIDPGLASRLNLVTPNRFLTMTDAYSGRSFHPGRSMPAIQGVISDRNWEARLGNTLFVTRCSNRYLNCVTTFISIPDVLLAKRNLLPAYVTIGGLTGGLFGFLFSLLCQRGRSMAQQLRRAIRKEKLRVVYQPIVDLATGRIVGAEALVRWTNESGIDVGPDVFVKLAEERGFVGSITKFVLRQALSDFHESLCTHPTFRLSVNVAAADLTDPTFLPALDRAIELASVPAGRLAIEITESSTVRSRIAIETIHRLRQRGHAVHIDDFGTGYSNLAYLHDLSVDAIKIDKTFVQAIGTDSVVFAILPQILSIAEALKLEVIVEGVETFLQARYFVDMGKRVLAQGWLFGRPVSAEELNRLLTEDAQGIADLQKKRGPILYMPPAVKDGTT